MKTNFKIFIIFFLAFKLTYSQKKSDWGQLSIQNLDALNKKFGSASIVLKDCNVQASLNNVLNEIQLNFIFETSKEVVEQYLYYRNISTNSQTFFVKVKNNFSANLGSIITANQLDFKIGDKVEWTVKTVFKDFTKSLQVFRGFIERQIDNIEPIKPLISDDENQDTNSKIFIAPNPVQNELTVELQTQQSGTASYLISDAIGNVQSRGEIKCEGGVCRSTLNTESLKQGLYIMQVTINGEVLTTKFIKK